MYDKADSKHLLKVNAAMPELWLMLGTKELSVNAINGFITWQKTTVAKELI
jgi:hypothetical protein